jgi:hypothetical protein
LRHASGGVAAATRLSGGNTLDCTNSTRGVSTKPDRRRTPVEREHF